MILFYYFLKKSNIGKDEAILSAVHYTELSCKKDLSLL